MLRIITMKDRILIIIGIIVIIANLIINIVTLCAYKKPEGLVYKECEVCGARIIEYWQVRDMNDDDWVKLCQFCYHDIAYE